MAKKAFNIKVVGRSALPRSERLRVSGGTSSAVASGAVSTSGGAASYSLDADKLDGKHFADIERLLDEKVTVEEGKGLSSNDYTDEDKEIVQNIETNLATKVDLDVYNEKVAELDATDEALQEGINDINEFLDEHIDQPVKTTSDVEFASVTAPQVGSENFRSGFGGWGYLLKQALGGNSSLEIDELTVRKTMTVFELIIQQLKHQGGIVVYSAASMECARVVNTGGGYKCFFDTKNGSVPNEFEVGDLARCQRFNLGNNTAKYYWRAVTAIGDDYIVLSINDCDSGSAVPEEGDIIAQFGHKTNVARQALKITTCIGVDTPRDEYYKGVNSYTLEGKLVTIVGVNNGEVGIFTKVGRFEGNIQIKPGSAGLGNLSEWAEANQRINNAQSAANEANTLIEATYLDIDNLYNSLSQLDDDNVLTTVEKRVLRNEWEQVVASYKTTLDIVTEIGYNRGDQVIYSYGDLVLTYGGIKLVYNYTGIEDFKLAYNLLSDCIVSLRIYENENTLNFNREEIATLLANYYEAQRILLNLAQKYYTLQTSTSLLSGFIEGDFKTLRDAAQALQTNLTNVQATANEAKAQLEDWAADDKISAVEKLALENEKVFIFNDKLSTDEQAAKYGVNTAFPSEYNTFVVAYNAYYNSIVSILDGFANAVTSVDIPSDFKTKQSGFYTQRTNIYARIAAAAKAIADIANEAKTSATNANNALGGKVDSSTYNTAIGSINNSLNAKVDTTTYNGGISSLNSAISNKVNITDYNTKVSEINAALGGKVNRGEYNERVGSVEDEIAAAQSALELSNSSIQKLEGVLSDINSDLVLDCSEKQNIKTQWDLIKNGSYPKALNLANELNIVTSRVSYDNALSYGDSKLVFGGNHIVYKDAYSGWLENLMLAYEALDAEMCSLHLEENKNEYYFNRPRFARVLAAYMTAESDFARKVLCLSAYSYIGDMAYLKSAFPNYLESDLMISKMIAVKGNYDEVKGIFNGSSQITEGDKGCLMLAAGIPIGSGTLYDRAKLAAARIYENGDAVFNNALISGAIASGKGLEMAQGSGSNARNVIIRNESVDTIMSQFGGGTSGTFNGLATIVYGDSSESSAVGGLTGGKRYKFTLNGTANVYIPSGYVDFYLQFDDSLTSLSHPYTCSISLAVEVNAKAYNSANELVSTVNVASASAAGDTVTKNPGELGGTSRITFNQRYTSVSIAGSNINSIMCPEGGSIRLETAIRATYHSFTEVNVHFNQTPSLSSWSSDNVTWTVAGGNAYTVIGIDGIVVTHGNNKVAIRNGGSSLQVEMLGLPTSRPSGSNQLYKDSNGFLKVS